MLTNTIVEICSTRLTTALRRPIRVYDGKVYVLDDVATMEIGDRDLITDGINSKLIYFAADGSSGVALQGDRGPSGARGLNGDSGDKGPVGSGGPSGKRDVEGPEGPPGKIGKIGPVGSRGGIGARGENGDKGDTCADGQQGPIGPQGSTSKVYKVLKDYVELLVSEVLLECNELLVLMVDKANVA